MKRTVLLLIALLPLLAVAQPLPDDYEAQSCTSIMVGKRASTDGSVITSHTCDGRYRTWMTIEPAADHKKGDYHLVRKGTMHTVSPTDTTGVRLAGKIAQAEHTYAYLNTAYPCLNERQLAIGETTFGGPDTLRNPNAMFQIEELERVALQRCTTARAAIQLIAKLVAKHGYSDGGECITIADKKEVWQMEIIGEGPDRIGGVWVAQRVPDDHVAVSANIPRIGRLQRSNPDYFMCSDNVEEVAKRYGLWDGESEFVFWRAYNASYANGKNFREREFHILSTLAPSQGFSMDMDELPFSVKPDSPVDVTDVMRLLRSTYEETDMDMCRNLKIVVNRKRDDGTTYPDTVVSPVANPWLTGTMQQTLNLIAPGTVDFRRTVSVAWCSYSFVAQLRDWLPDAVGGVCWVAVDNPGQSPRIPIFCGTTELPEAFARCGQKQYDPTALLWQYRRANKLATVQWQRTKKQHLNAVLHHEGKAFSGLNNLEQNVAAAKNAKAASRLLNDYTRQIYDGTVAAWLGLEADYWQMFGMGF
ncbi:MAG: C69 family dipeptidase [Bacteroidales bacterium]|nr:C69 family dipeptidase [Bacteroidales bacterium]